MDIRNGEPYFRIGEWVVAVDAVRGAFIKNGQIYEIIDVPIYRANGFLWWGVCVHVRPGHIIAPRIFRPLQLVPMAFKEINEAQPIIAN